jgi:SAM-dependent methyltransferase
VTGDAPERASAELRRIRDAYQRRDALPPAEAPYESAAYQFHIQQLEWTLLSALRRDGVRLAGADVLEVGCGSGYFLHRLLEFGARHASGIDLMESRIEYARKRYPALELVSGDAGELPWEPEAFDLVTQFTCISSVLDADARARIAAEMWRVLRPGGALVSYDMRPAPMVSRALADAHRLRAGADRGGGRGRSTPTRPVSLGELKNWFPAGEMRHQTASLHLELAVVAGRGRLLATLLEALPMMRTHLLVVVKRPAR